MEINKHARSTTKYDSFSSTMNKLAATDWNWIVEDGLVIINDERLPRIELNPHTGAWKSEKQSHIHNTFSLLKRYINRQLKEQKQNDTTN